MLVEEFTCYTAQSLQNNTSVQATVQLSSTEGHSMRVSEKKKILSDVP